MGERHIEMKHWVEMGWKNYGQQSSSSRGIKWKDPKGYMCFVVKKGKRKNLKMVVTRKLNKLNFLKYYHFLPQQEVKNVCFLENLVCFVFFKPLFWDLPFSLIINCFHVFLSSLFHEENGAHTWALPWKQCAFYVYKGKY